MVRFLPVFALLAALLLPLGCSQDASISPVAAPSPAIRVLILNNVDRIDLVTGGAQVAVDSLPAPALPGDFSLVTTLASDGWHFGKRTLRGSVVEFIPSNRVPVRINGVQYRGSIRLMPTGGGRFNVINTTVMEDYLAGVVTREMYSDWPIEAIKAQAVASRTYAFYQVGAEGKGRPWDVYGDERSQMYGGINGETKKSRQAVAATQGIVLTYGPGDGSIFKAYFSSCCGGVSQAASDAFPGEPYIPPLAEQSRGAICNGSKYFNWGPITISKVELTRRFHIWGQHQIQITGHAIPEASMATVNRIDIQGVNRYGRPNRILITDARGVQYSWPAEQLRTAVNTDAQPGSTLPSSFCKINASANSTSVTFYEGHGFGHGVGMCQWCAEAEASGGQNFAQILEEAYPQAKLVRAY